MRNVTKPFPADAGPDAVARAVSSRGDCSPPACLCVRTKNLEYLALGRYESNDSTGREIFFWGAVEVVWPLPGVIALFPRERVE